MDTTKEPDYIYEMYATRSQKFRVNLFAANCLLGKEDWRNRDVRCITVITHGWIKHDNLPGQLRNRQKMLDQASAALG